MIKRLVVLSTALDMPIMDYSFTTDLEDDDDTVDDTDLTVFDVITRPIKH